LRSWFTPQNLLSPQRDQLLLLPVDMREWLPEDDLAFVVLDAVATLDLGEFRRRYRADGHGRAASGPEMMVALLLLYGYCQGEQSSRVTGKRCVRDVACRVIAGGLCPEHAAIARFRARHERALGGLFSQVLRAPRAGQARKTSPGYARADRGQQAVPDAPCAPGSPHQEHEVSRGWGTGRAARGKALVEGECQGRH
jgi:transposase